MNPTILVVEDDATLRMLVVDDLSMLEAHVIACRCADDALQVLQRQTPINLVLTDIRMPGHLDGLDLATLIWQQWPKLPVILTSGHRQLSVDQLPAHATFMAKP